MVLPAQQEPEPAEDQMLKTTGDLDLILELHSTTSGSEVTACDLALTVARVLPAHQDVSWWNEGGDDYRFVGDEVSLRYLHALARRRQVCDDADTFEELVGIE